MNVGVLALQGDFREHIDVLTKLKVPTVEVRLPEDLDRVERLIIPGGESTTIGKLLVLYKLIEPVRARAKKDMPLWGTCAGAILMAKHLASGTPRQPSLALVDITARRNAFGRQLDSFETEISMPKVDKKPISVAFIRAPILEHPGKRVEILATLQGGTIVAAQEKNMLATCFHPELMGNVALHRSFLSM
mgnify:CR=1 FL=1